MLFLFVENDETIYSTMGNQSLLGVLKPDVNVNLPNKGNYKILEIGKQVKGSVESYLVKVKNAEIN